MWGSGVRAPYAPLNKIDRPTWSVDFVCVNKKGGSNPKGRESKRMLPVEGFAASGANRLKEEVKDGRLETICKAPYAPLNKIDRPIGSVDFVCVNKRGDSNPKGRESKRMLPVEGFAASGANRLIIYKQI